MKTEGARTGRAWLLSALILPMGGAGISPGGASGPAGGGLEGPVLSEWPAVVTTDPQGTGGGGHEIGSGECIALWVQYYRDVAEGKLNAVPPACDPEGRSAEDAARIVWSFAVGAA